MDANGSRSKAIARLLKKLGVQEVLNAVMSCSLLACIQFVVR
jgi:hypothetical protein